MTSHLSVWLSLKTTNDKCWRGYVENMEKRLYCSWECKLVLPLWRTVWRFLKKLKIELPYDPAIQLLGINPEKTILQEDTHKRRSQAGGGLGRGDHFLSYKFIKRITERRANFTKQLLIASWGHQAPRKAAHCLRKKVGQNIKDKKRDKEQGVLHWQVWGEFLNLGGQPD